mgnify:CR=1 FL=1
MDIFYLENCPHCIRARKWIDELCEENEAYREIDLKWIEESQNEEYASRFDYYYVPCIFDGNHKLHEGVASKEIIQNIFDDYLRRK